mmetsp:Transcript_76468/g.185065  ORF Transcript_76468/g.185065 Transcript_76468/m.185065 type:complete len:412 (+) Transcript_76468:3-1238(+)
MLLPLLAAARAAERCGDAGGACPWEGEAAEDAAAEDAAGARLLQHAAQLQGPLSALEVAGGASEGLHAGSARPQSVGFHSMMLLQPAGASATKDVTNFVENVLKFDTCFTEILVTLDYGVHTLGDDYHARIKVPGAALKYLNDSHAVAQFLCEVKQQTRHVADKLERRCGGKVSAAVHVLDPSLPHVRSASRRIFGPRELPRRMFKNTVAYLYGPAVMKADYIVHADDDVFVDSNGPRGTFVQQAMQVLDHSTMAAVNMPCCTCGEIQHLTEFSDSKSPKFSRLAVGHFHWVSPRPDNMWKVPGLDNARCADVQNFFTMQAYIFHAQRVRAMFPMRIEGSADPAEMHIECLLSEAAKMTTPPTLLGIIGEGVSQCRRMRQPSNQGPLLKLRHGAGLRRCMASPFEEASAAL